MGLQSLSRYRPALGALTYKRAEFQLHRPAKYFQKSLLDANNAQVVQFPNRLCKFGLPHLVAEKSGQPRVNALQTCIDAIPESELVLRGAQPQLPVFQGGPIGNWNVGK